jgi:anti-sigma B factor antagonist
MLQMNCDVGERRASVVSVAGDIDWRNSGELHAAIHGALTGDPIARLVVDLHGVTRIDSSGLGTLLDGLRAAQHKDVRFILCGLENSLRRVLERMRLSALFEIRPTRQEALQQLATSG